MDTDTRQSCTSCSQTPQGEAGHPYLRFYVSGPYPGHRIFKCDLCGDRWIRHYGDEDERHAWTRFVVATRPAPATPPGLRSAAA